jgi:hypothetical protein
MVGSTTKFQQIEKLQKIINSLSPFPDNSEVKNFKIEVEAAIFFLAGNQTHSDGVMNKLAKEAEQIVKKATLESKNASSNKAAASKQIEELQEIRNTLFDFSYIKEVEQLIFILGERITALVQGQPLSSKEAMKRFSEEAKKLILDEAPQAREVFSSTPNTSTILPKQRKRRVNVPTIEDFSAEAA